LSLKGTRSVDWFHRELGRIMWDLLRSGEFFHHLVPTVLRLGYGFGLALLIGFGVSLVSFLYAIFIAMRVLIEGIDVPGYASLMVAITFLGGIQLIGIGIIGEYLGRVAQEVRHRPLYVVAEESEPVVSPDAEIPAEEEIWIDQPMRA
jgi:glycosyltransferase involved in cell wall biosynthesis